MPETAYCKYCASAVEYRSGKEFHGHLQICFPVLTRHTTYTDIQNFPETVGKTHFVSKKYDALKPKDPKCFLLVQPKIDLILLQALSSNGVRGTVKEKLRSFWFKDPGSNLKGFGEKIKISATVAIQDEKIYYRKMSPGEWLAAQSAKGNRFDATFNFTDTANYRYWMSSSLAKVKAFGNENAQDNSSVTVQMTFKESLLGHWKNPQAHAQKGVQTNPEVVSIHREGFAEIGLMENGADVQEVIGHTPRLDHNLGFSSKQSAKLWELFQSAQVLA